MFEFSRFCLPIESRLIDCARSNLILLADFFNFDVGNMTLFIRRPIFVLPDFDPLNAQTRQGITKRFQSFSFGNNHSLLKLDFDGVAISIAGKFRTTKVTIR
jgi:hypothetical protein